MKVHGATRAWTRLSCVVPGGGGGGSVRVYYAMRSGGEAAARSGASRESVAHSVRNQASRNPPNPEIFGPTVQSCSYTCYRNMVEHTRTTQHAKIAT